MLVQGPLQPLELEKDRLSRAQIQSLAQHDLLSYNPPRRAHICRLEALACPRQIRDVVCVVNDEPPRGYVALPERVEVGRRGRGVTHQVEVDVDRWARPRAACEPRVEVDEHSAHEVTVLERGIARDVAVADIEFDQLRRTGASNDSVDDEAGVERGLDVRRLRWVEGRAVQCRAVEGDGLDLGERG